MCETVFSPTQSSLNDNSVFVCSTTVDAVLSPVSPIIFDWTPQHGGDEDGDGDGGDQSTELVRRDSSNSALTQARSLPPDLAMIAPSPVVSPILEFRMPAYSEFSNQSNRRALVDHFCNVLSHLIVFREESGNPFQQLVLPLAHQSSPVLNAVYALASAHMEYRGLDPGEKSLVFHNRAIQDLARLIRNEDGVNKNELLAAIMLLVYYEVVRSQLTTPKIRGPLAADIETQLVQRGRTNIVDGHLKGALTIMNSSHESNHTTFFLERVRRYQVLFQTLHNPLNRY